MLEEPPYEKAAWLKLAESKGESPATAYPIVEVIVGVNAKFRQAAPKLVAFLTDYQTSNKLISEALAYMQDTKDATAEDAAAHFLKTREDVWTAWVPQDVAQRVKASLK